MVKRNAHGQSVVCSEKTKARGKVKSIALAVAAASAMLSSVDVVAATTLGENQTITDTTSVAIGNNVIATGADTVAVGDYTKATGDESTALGERATTFGNQSTATGSYAFADGNQSTSNGHASSAMAIDTIAIGANSGAAGGSMSKEDWDKLIVIDREIKEIDPSQFTTTITIPPTEPDRTRLTTAESGMNEKRTTTKVAATISPYPMITGLPPEDGEIADYKLDGTSKNIYPVSYATVLNSEAVEFYNALNKTSRLPTLDEYWSDLTASKHTDGIDSHLIFIGEKSPATFGWLGKQLDITTLTTENYEQVYRDNIELAKSIDNFNAENITPSIQAEYERIKNYALNNLNKEAIDLAVSLYDGSYDSSLITAFESTPEKTQELKDAIYAVYMLKNIRTAYGSLTTSVDTDGINHAGYNMDDFITIYNSTWDFRTTEAESYEPANMMGNFKYIASKISFADQLTNAYNELKGFKDEYDAALAEYETAVAAGGTGGTTTTTTDLAAYEAALAEKRAELTRLANASGFDGIFESLSDVFGSKAGRAIAIGNSAYVSGDEAIGVGYGNTVTGSRSNVIGTHNNVTKANNNVMGNDNNITVSEGNVIVGNAITFAQGVTTRDNIALGSNTVISAPVPTASVEIQGVTHNFAGTTPTSVLSIASEGNERQVQNVAAGRVTNTSTDAINGSQLYAVVEALNAIQTINIDDISDAISTEINITGGDNVQVSREGNNFTISATGSTLTAGDNITVEGDATSGYTIKATNTQSVVKAGNGVTVDVADNDIGTKDYTVSTKIGDGLTFGDNGEIKATGTIINAGDNITVTGDAINGYTISTKGGVTDEQLQDVINQINGIVDTNTQSTTSAGQGIVVTETDNTNGTKNYAVSIKATDGLTFDDNGNIKVSDTLVKAGDNVQVSGNAKDGFTVSAKGTEITAGDNVNVSGDAKNGYTISVENMRTTVTGGQGAEVTSSDNTDGSKNHTVNVKVGEGLTYDDKGNVVNDMKLTASENVQISGNAKGGYTISATDTNTQATVSADKGITITETNNANGTKNYAVSAKLGKGLKVDENGAIAATAQPINGGAGVSITTNAQDEAVVNVAGVTTMTDDGKSYTRSDLTKSVGVKGDGKNIRTSTAANGDVQVKLADDIQVNSVSIHNGPTINQQGINAANTRITNVQDGVAPTDAVNVRQLNQQGNILNQRIDNLADNVKKNKKRNDAGIASTAAMANIPQVMLAGKSGVGVGVGHRSGQNAIAVGYSRASDNAKHIIKLSAGLDTQSKATFGAGYMYQW